MRVISSVDEVNRILTEEAATKRYEACLACPATRWSPPTSWVIHEPSVVDLGLTRVIDGDLVKIMSWYDDEWGYANPDASRGTVPGRSEIALIGPCHPHPEPE